MANKNKLQKLLEVFSPDGTAVDFTEFDKQVEQLKTGLKQKIQAKTLEDVNTQLESFRKRLDFTSLFEAMSTLETALDQKIAGVSGLMSEEFVSFKKLLSDREAETSDNISSIASNITNLQEQLTNLNDQKTGELALLKTKLDKLQDFSTEANKTLTQLGNSIEEVKNDTSIQDEMTERVTEFTSIVDTLRKELNNRINNLPRGGNANRNIAIGSNTSVLSRYTDINLKAGSNVTITYSNNDTTKYVDVTIASSGGGSSVAGTVRSISTINTSQTAGNTSGTDYVYICSAGVQLTLPDAASNTNLYTIKNTSTSSVLIATTSAQTIDTQSNLILATQFTSVDLISDNSNWEIT